MGMFVECRSPRFSFSVTVHHFVHGCDCDPLPCLWVCLYVSGAVGAYSITGVPYLLTLLVKFQPQTALLMLSSRKLTPPLANRCKSFNRHALIGSRPRRELVGCSAVGTMADGATAVAAPVVLVHNNKLVPCDSTSGQWLATAPRGDHISSLHYCCMTVAKSEPYSVADESTSSKGLMGIPTASHLSRIGCLQVPAAACLGLGQGC